MIEFGKHHYADIDQRRTYYCKELGTPPIDSNIYNYYLNMIGMVIQPNEKRFLEKFRRKRNIYPYTIAAKQELTKILMIVQQDIIRQFDSISGSVLASKIPDVDTLHMIFEPRERMNKIQQIFGCTHTGAPRVDLLLHEINSLKNEIKNNKKDNEKLLQEIGAMKLKYIPDTKQKKRWFR